MNASFYKRNNIKGITIHKTSIENNRKQSTTHVVHDAKDTEKRT